MGSGKLLLQKTIGASCKWVNDVQIKSHWNQRAGENSQVIVFVWVEFYNKDDQEMATTGWSGFTLMMESPPSFWTDSLNSAISFLVHIEAGVTRRRNRPSI